MSFFNHKNRHKDWDTERTVMVEQQLKPRGISDQMVLHAMSKVPREAFVSEEYRNSAYTDGPLPIGEGQTISQPYMVAIMTQSLHLKKSDKVLEIGTGSGYQMAVLLEITPNVYSVERLPTVAKKAIENLSSLGYKDVNIKVTDGTCGWPENAPFDGIIVTSGAPDVPEPLKEQLSYNGRLVIPVGSRYSQELLVITRRGNTFDCQEVTSCVFVPLIGKYGWKQN